MSVLTNQKLHLLVWFGSPSLSLWHCNQWQLHQLLHLCQHSIHWLSHCGYRSDFLWDQKNCHPWGPPTVQWAHSSSFYHSVDLSTSALSRLFVQSTPGQDATRASMNLDELCTPVVSEKMEFLTDSGAEESFMDWKFANQINRYPSISFNLLLNSNRLLTFSLCLTSEILTT